MKTNSIQREILIWTSPFLIMGIGFTYARLLPQPTHRQPAVMVSIGAIKANYNNQTPPGDIAGMAKLAALVKENPDRVLYSVGWENVYPDNFRDGHSIAYCPNEGNRVEDWRRLTDYFQVTDEMISATAANGETITGLAKNGAIAKPMDMGWCGTSRAEVAEQDRRLKEGRLKAKRNKANHNNVAR